MQDLPHSYSVVAKADEGSHVLLTSTGLDALESAAPAEFGGPGDRWSPETLLVAAVADCFVLSFKAIARASRFPWTGIHCDVSAVLDRVDGVTRFTEFRQRVILDVPAGSEERKALRLLEKAEKVCLITNSLKGETHLEADVRTAG